MTYYEILLQIFSVHFVLYYNADINFNCCESKLKLDKKKQKVSTTSGCSEIINKTKNLFKWTITKRMFKKPRSLKPAGNAIMQNTNFLF